MVAPERLADRSDKRRSGRVVFSGKASSHQRRDPERVEEIQRDERTLDLFGLAIAEKVELIAPVSANALDGLGLLANVVEVRPGLPAMQGDQPVGRGVREGP